MPFARPILFRFVWMMLLLIVVVFAVSVALEYLLNYQISAGTGIVVVIVPAMDAGQQFFKLAGRAPEKGEAWRYAAVVVALNMVVGCILAGLMVLASGGIFFGIGLSMPLIVGVVVALIYVLAPRLFFGLGARQAQKVAASPS